MIANVIMPNKMTLSRTNYRKRLPVPKLNKIRSTLPRRNYDAEEINIKEIVEPPSSNENFVVAPRVESINFEKIVTEQQVEEIG